ncbi:MAG: aminopeptidase [Gemmatimonadetes bacterium]|nr:aminopeptidase [Gemmatimonadota bacterium]
MTDPRYTKLAQTLIHYSCELKAGEKLLIEAIDTPTAFTNELVRVAHEAEVVPNVLLKSNEVLRRLLLRATEEQLDLMAASEETYMKGVDAYIGVRGAPNVSELSDVSQDRQKMYERFIWKRVHMDIRVPDTRWVVLRWPNASMAQLAERSTEDFEDFYFRVCTMDYERMSEALKPLRELMEATDRVHVKGPGTDLQFSIAGIPAMPCDGKRNIPDGEVFTAPVRDSIEGTIQYNTPTIYQGVTHEDVFFRFREGKIVEARSTSTDHLNEVLDADEGARYIGEFSLGFHPHIMEPMKDILFDEKIAGSMHLTPGNAYDTAFNGNRSQIHWDLVLIQRPEYGGGEVWFDDVLIRKDGIFVLPELDELNPEKLGA